MATHFIREKIAYH